MELETHSQCLPPTRGVVPLANRQGTSFALADLKRWLLLTRDVFKCQRVDLIANNQALENAPELVDYAKGLELNTSLRTDCSAKPDTFAQHEINLDTFQDICLAPPKIPSQEFDEWLHAAKQADRPVRVIWPVPLHHIVKADAFAQEFADGGVTHVHFAAYDILHASQPACKHTDETEETLERITAIIPELQTRGIETTILNIPFCHVPQKFWPHVANSRQQARTHPHYQADARTLAEKLLNSGPVAAGKILLITQAKYTFFDDPIDQRLLPWLLDRPWLRARIVAWHKLTRHLRITRAVPRPLPETESDAEIYLKERTSDLVKEIGPECGVCRMRHVCDHAPPEFKRAMPGLQVSCLNGDVVMDPVKFARQNPVHLDDLEKERLHRPQTNIELAARANDIMANVPHDTEIDSFDYQTEGQWCHQLPGGVRWFGFTNSEKVSTPLATLDPPFTLSMVVGGGIAEFAGFSLGRDCKLVCPMEGYNHTFVLHVEEDGQYVLLRDGIPVDPLQFEGRYYAPQRLGDRLQPRISIWNIDNTIVTQNVTFWSDAIKNPTPPKLVKFSVVTVCVRYARRLQAVMQSVAHQHGTDLTDIEFIVAYVPGVDSTDDVLDSMEAAHPDFAIHRSTFTEDKARAKGFIINETLEKASGDWVVLLDGDTMLPPDFFQRLAKHTDDADFIVPDGRKLLSRETTAQILLGEIKPWEQWDDLLKTEGELRYREADGVPIGFCQVVRRACFEKVKYFEVDHFEGADWQFSIDMRKHFSEEVRLSGTPVLHLDHGGSKWYGATRHF